MLGPHIFGLEPVASSISFAIAKQSSRRSLSGICLRNSLTLAAVGLVFSSAIKLLVPLVFLIDGIRAEFVLLEKVPRGLIELRSLIVVPVIVIRNLDQFDGESFSFQRIAGRAHDLDRKKLVAVADLNREWNLTFREIYQVHVVGWQRTGVDRSGCEVLRFHQSHFK